MFRKQDRNNVSVFSMPMQQPTKGKMDTAKPKMSDVKFGYAPAGRKGKKA